RTAGWFDGRDADGHRRIARRGRHLEHEHVRGEPRGARRDPDDASRHDGARVNNLCGSGQYSGFYMNDGAIQELSYLTGAESAEIQSSGIRVNQVPKDGGNRFSGAFFLYGQGSALQSDNRTDAMKALQANGLPLISIAGTAYDWQVNPSFGGPLAKDKLWFFATYKYQDNKIYVPSSRYADG